MSDGSIEIHADPVADGLPSWRISDFLTIAIAFLVLVYSLYIWDVALAIYTQFVILFVFLLARSRRRYWMHGYHTGVETTRERLEDTNEQDT